MLLKVYGNKFNKLEKKLEKKILLLKIVWKDLVLIGLVRR